MSATRIVMIGGGGHAWVLRECLLGSGKELAGYTDRAPTSLPEVPYLGTDDDLPTPGPEIQLILGLGTVAANPWRWRVFERLKTAGYQFMGVIHPSAVVASDVEPGEGAQILARAIVQPGVTMGPGALVNSGAIVEHHCILEGHTHIGPGAILAASVQVGKGAFVGAGARVVQGIHIGAGACVGAGAVVTRDVDPATTVVGIPARLTTLPLGSVPDPDQTRVPLCPPYLTGEEWPALKSCLESGWVSTTGPQVDAFAAAFSGYLGVPHAIPLQSGTAAIHMGLLALGVGPGDRVMVPSLSFIASANPIRYLGAEPVFVDSDPASLSLDPIDTLATLEAMVANSTPPKAVIAVHLYGHCADLDPVLKRCSQLGIPVLEDATEALGARYRGRHPGTLGTLGCFSFNGNKLITCGAGGMVVTSDPELASRIEYLSTQAKDDPVRYLHGEVGYNLRMTALQAALGSSQLGHIEEFLERKRAIALRYRDGLADLPGFTLVPEASWSQPSWWNFCAFIDPKKSGASAWELVQALQREGIESRPFFPPIHLQKPYRGFCQRDLPVATALWESGLVLPCGVGLTIQQQDRVLRTLRCRQPGR